jgi:hypothetical protein
MVLALSNTGVVGSNSARGMDACLPFFCVCVFLFIGSGLETGLIPVHEILPTVYKINRSRLILMNTGQMDWYEKWKMKVKKEDNKVRRRINKINGRKNKRKG